MLAVSPLRNTTTNNEYEKQDQTGSFKSSGFGKDEVDLDFSDGGLLDSIDFDDLFLGINDGDVLPDLEVDPEILAEFSGGGSSSGESEKNTSVSDGKVEHIPRKDEEDKVSGSGSGIHSSTKGEEIVSKRDESKVVSPIVANKECYNNNKGRKSSSTQAKNNNNNQGKKKVKVDWTPELHRRFVQAVEQLGVDKAVPSRILELMGIDCLTRHNIASHLQKYRSHRKHLLAREAEAANWSQRRQLYGGAATVGGGGGGKRNTTPWHAPTMGFLPITPMHAHPFRPLHVWGHPSMDQSLIHIWPKHLAHSPSPLSTWAPPPPPDPSYWHHHRQRVPNGLTPGTPCFPRPIAVAPPPARSFGTSTVPGIPPHGMYKVDHHGNNIGVCVSSPQSTLVPSFDLHPTKESIDAAIGDVVSKPWLPLPLGLKPPALDSVLVELQRHGVPKIPPAAAAAAISS